MGMEANQRQDIQKEPEDIFNNPEEAKQYVKEIQIQHSIGALILAGLVAVVFQTFSYLVYGTIVTELDKIVFMFSLLIGPSAFFLLLLHLYEIDGIIKRGEKSIPLTLDLMYFLYLLIAFATMVGLHSYYQRHSISWNILTTGWSLAVVVLSVEVLIALLIAKYIVTIFITPKLPHFFEHPPQKRKTRLRPLQQPVAKPTQLYYFRKKPDVSLWEGHPCFVRYKQ
jgi:hypothetical protein